MNADCYFTGTKAHKVCQDYARASHILGKTYAIVSDGCSSSPDTDIGARLLTLAAANTLPNVIGSYWPVVKAGDSEPQPQPLSPQAVLEKARHALFSPPWTPLLPTCLDATLLVAYEVPQGVAVDVAGDGVVIGRKRDKTCLVYDFDCEGAPSYLSYLADSDRMTAYLEQYGKRKIQVSKFSFTILPDRVGMTMEGLSFHNEQPFTGQADYAGQAKPFYHCVFDKSFDLVLLLTDGVKSFFTEPAMHPVPVAEVLAHLLNFKSFAGEFVTRRVQTFLKRETNWQHSDDLGVAGIYMGHDSANN